MLGFSLVLEGLGYSCPIKGSKTCFHQRQKSKSGGKLAEDTRHMCDCIQTN